MYTDFVITLAIGFILGILVIQIGGKINYKKETAEMISCPFDLAFLTSSKIGYHDKQGCIDLNLALHSQYLDECSDLIPFTQDKKQYEYLLEQCVYHKFSINFLVLTQENLSFENK